MRPRTPSRRPNGAVRVVRAPPLTAAEEANRRHRSTLRQLYAAIAVYLAVVVLSTLVYYEAGWTLLESLYMVVITIFGVGYGEVHPLDAAPGLRAFTIFLIVSGHIVTLVIFGGVVKLIAEGEINKVIGELRKARNIEGVSAHTIICGYGRIGQVLAHELASDGQPFVIVDRAGDRLDMAEAAGYLCVRGNATDEETLLRAGIKRAAALATVLPEDAANVYITLTARSLHKQLRIIARGEQPSAEKKLLAAGADEVVLPSTIGAQRIARSVTRPASTAVLSDLASVDALQELDQLGLSMSEYEIGEGGPFVGKSLGELQHAANGTLLVVALRHPDGSVLERPPPTQRLVVGDRLVALVQPRHLPAGLLAPAARGEAPT